MVGKGKRVLELGPGPGSITRLLNNNACRITALEFDPNAVNIVSRYCEVVLRCDLNDPNWYSLVASSEKFQVIVAADVLEHLHDPWSLMKKLKLLLTEDGQVVVSLPNAGHNAVVSCLLCNDFAYRPLGLLDRTHLRFFGIANIQRLFNDAGFKIVEADFIVAAPERTEFAGQWRSLSMATRKALSSNKFGTVYQVVVRAVSASAPGKGLQIASLAVPRVTSNVARIRVNANRVMGKVFSLSVIRLRDAVSQVLHYLGLRRR